MVALGCGLAEHGHQVAIAASLDFRETVTASGLDYEEINASVAELSRTAAGREWLGGRPATKAESYARCKISSHQLPTLSPVC